MKKQIATILFLALSVLVFTNEAKAQTCVQTITHTTTTNRGEYVFTATGTASGSVNYWWQFSDGSMAWGTTVTHTFYTRGPQAAQLNFTDFIYNCSYTGIDSFSVSQAGCSSSITDQYASDTVFTFYPHNVGVAPYSYRWFFPDGSSSTSSNPTYTIGSTGTYGILLTVTDSTGCMDTSYLAVQDTANINPCTAFVYDSLFSNGTLHWYYASGFFSSSATLNWDFGDNTFATGNSVSHNYTSNGRYTVTLTVIDSLHNCSFVVTTTSVVTGAAGGSGCQASISSLCNAPGVYTFNAVGNFAPPSTAALTWSFGDGTSGMGQSVTHAYYNISGYVTICLSIYDSMAQCQNTVCDTILISGRSSPCSTRIGSTHIDTTFSLYTINTGVAPFTYVWRLPTGTYNVYTSSSFPSPVISLPIPTPYTAYPVWVYVTDSVGCVDSAWAYIYPDSTLLSPNACQAFFVMIEDTTTAGDYYAVDLSIGSGGSLTYTWSFGDGTSATGQYPTHTYSTPGYYTVCLNIMDSLNSCNSTFCDSTFYAHKRLGGPMSSFSVRPRGAAGVADIKQTTDLFTIYPNPATSVVEFRINSSDKIIKSAIFSVSGKKVAETGSATQVSVSNLALGMYFVEIITNTGTYRSSFVKHD